MSVPEASVYKDYCIISGEDKVRFFRIAFITNSIAESKLNVPGMTTADKKNSELGTDTQEMFDKMSLYQIFGNPETYETQLKESKNICLYLIGKTANQDEFILRNKFTNESWTSLYYAVETDDADICRKLIEKGANPNLYLPMAKVMEIHLSRLP